MRNWGLPETAQVMLANAAFALFFAAMALRLEVREEDTTPEWRRSGFWRADGTILFALFASIVPASCRPVLKTYLRDIGLSNV